MTYDPNAQLGDVRIHIKAHPTAKARSKYKTENKKKKEKAHHIGELGEAQPVEQVFVPFITCFLEQSKQTGTKAAIHNFKSSKEMADSKVKMCRKQAFVGCCCLCSLESPTGPLDRFTVGSQMLNGHEILRL